VFISIYSGSADNIDHLARRNTSTRERRWSV
jgi:hypothetical protein